MQVCLFLSLIAPTFRISHLSFEFATAGIQLSQHRLLEEPYQALLQAIELLPPASDPSVIEPQCHSHRPFYSLLQTRRSPTWSEIRTYLDSTFGSAPPKERTAVVTGVFGIGAVAESIGRAILEGEFEVQMAEYWLGRLEKSVNYTR